MDEIEKALERHHKRTHKEIHDDLKISRAFTKILISIILVLSCAIYINLNASNKSFFQEKVFSTSLEFNKLNNLYHSLFGNILPSVRTASVIKNDNSSTREPYLNGYKISEFKNSPVYSKASGILVYNGEKEGYGNTLIIQGVDGTDIWYGSITDTNYKLYDYIESGTIIGNTINDYYYLVLLKENNYLTYEEYFKNV